MTDTSNPKRAGKREFKAKAILTSGIPLEMAVYDFLASGLGADWIEPEHEFAALNETEGVIQRSLDFVASVPTSRNPLDERSVQLYLLTECKYCNPNELIWLFMPDVAPKVANIFDDWRPALWQRASHGSQFKQEKSLGVSGERSLALPNLMVKMKPMVRISGRSRYSPRHCTNSVIAYTAWLLNGFDFSQNTGPSREQLCLCPSL